METASERAYRLAFEVSGEEWSVLDRRPRWLRVREEHFESFDEKDFTTRFRLPKRKVLSVLELIEDQLEFPTNKNHSISPINQLLCALRFYATGCHQTAVADFSGFSTSTANRVVHKVSCAIASLKDRVIRFPETQAEMRKTQMGFYSKANFPRVLGALDCTHVRYIRSPESRACGEADGEGRESWRVTLDHDLVETLSAIYPEWFKPQPRRARQPSPPSHSPSPSLPSPPSPPSPPRRPQHSPHSSDTSHSPDSDSESEMEGGEASTSGSPVRPSPPKAVVDASPLHDAMDKNKEALELRLLNRRPRNQLVAQGIMAPLKTPPAFFEQRKQLERAKTSDLLKAKIQRRPDRQELERRHILEQEGHLDPSLAEKQRMLKKARLADQLNDQLSHRPGPLELIKKNILHTEEPIETAVKQGLLPFKATSEGASARPQHPSQYCGPPEELSPSPSPPSTLSPASIASPPQHPAPGKEKKSKKSKFKQQPKSRPIKFHEYKGPPNAHKANTLPGSVETPYELLLQQQQLFLQLIMSASPSASPASSDRSETPQPPAPPPLPVRPAREARTTCLNSSRVEDWKVPELRAECKRLNLHVSGPKPQLIERLRPYLVDKNEEPRSPMSVASITSVASPAESVKEGTPEIQDRLMPTEDIVQSQRRQIEELERKLEASRQQLEAVRREAAGNAATDQGRRLLQAKIYVSELRKQLDALQQVPPPPPPEPPRYVIAAPNTSQDRVVRLIAVSPQQGESTDPGKPAYILNGVKVVPIAILPTTYEAPAAAPPPPPPLPQPLAHSTPQAMNTAEDSQIMDDVLEILVENGELPPSAVQNPSVQGIDADFLSANTFSPADVLSGDSVLGESISQSELGADELQKELSDIEKEILQHADLHCISDDTNHTSADLGVDLLSSDEFTDFGGDHSMNHDEIFNSLIAQHDAGYDAPMEEEPPPPPPPPPPYTNGDILETERFNDMDDLSLASFGHEDMQHNGVEIDLKEFGIELEEDVSMEGVGGVGGGGGGGCEMVGRQWGGGALANVFGRGHVARCDPLLGAPHSPLGPPAHAHAAPHQHYSWDRIDYDPT